jgi:hypothetical protein
MRASSARGLLICCSDSAEPLVSGDRWSDDFRLSDIKAALYVPSLRHQGRRRWGGFQLGAAHAREATPLRFVLFLWRLVRMRIDPWWRHEEFDGLIRGGRFTNNRRIRLAKINARPHTINAMPKTSILALVIRLAVHSVGIHCDSSGSQECPIQPSGARLIAMPPSALRLEESAS